MAAPSDGISFYFFDFDDNIMFLATPIFLRNAITHEEQAVSTKEFASIQPLLGRSAPWADYAVFGGSFRNFRDIPPGQLAPGQKQHFVADVEKAVAAHDCEWQGPSWKLFAYACDQQRPISIVTARGHSRETLKAGVRVLVDRGLITREPLYHTIFPVGNDDVRRELGDTNLDTTTPALKRRAIIATVEQALTRYGEQPDHRFGMSDDDPQNVDLIIRAMCECKRKYPDKRFFVINTHMHEEVKLEVFPADMPVTGPPGSRAPDLLRQ